MNLPKPLEYLLVIKTMPKESQNGDRMAILQRFVEGLCKV